MNNAIFSTTGRLTRRDYALTQGALFGGASLFTFGIFSLLLPLVYLCAEAFFRNTSAAFWGLLIAGLLLIVTLIYAALPLLAIPATVRRLHDIGRGGWLAFPLLLASLSIFGFLLFVLLLILGTLEALTGIPMLSGLFRMTPEETDLIIGSVFLGYFLLCLITFLILSVYAAWIFLKKGSSLANRYGAPPVEEALPSVRAAYLSMQGAIDRHSFVLRTLIAVAVAGVIFPALGQSVLYPVAAILGALGLVPVGTDFFALLLGTMIYPLAALPLVMRRLHTLGRSGWEALLVFAALIPNLLCTAALARFLGSLDLIDEDEIGEAIIEEFLTIGTSSDSLFIALWVLCAVLSLIGILRLLGSNDENGAAV